MSNIPSLLRLLDRIRSGCTTYDDSIMVATIVLTGLCLTGQMDDCHYVAAWLESKGVTQSEITRVTADFNGIPFEEMERLIEGLRSEIDGTNIPDKVN